MKRRITVTIRCTADVELPDNLTDTKAIIQYVDQRMDFTGLDSADIWGHLHHDYVWDNITYEVEEA